MWVFLRSLNFSTKEYLKNLIRTVQPPVSDHFALLNEPRRPWLDADALKEKFHALSAQHHPDVAENNSGVESMDFAQLNAAYQTLRDPVARLRHLLELEFPQALAEQKQRAAIPPDIADLFSRICQLQQALQNFRTRETQASNPVGRALLAPEKLALREQLEITLCAVKEKHHRCLDEIRIIDATWPPPSLDDIATKISALHSQLAYLAKWTKQLRDYLSALI